MFDVVGKREQLEWSMQWLVHSARNADDRSREYRLAFYLCETHRFAAAEDESEFCKHLIQICNMRFYAYFHIFLDYYCSRTLLKC